MPGPERSLGCYRCRSMKLKCDQEHPACRRCQRVSVPCPGYRPENDLIFVDISNKVREREVAPRSKCNARKNSSAQSSERLAESPGPPMQAYEEKKPMALTPLYKSPYVTDWSEHALTRFMSEFTMDTQDLSVSPGFLHNLPQLYQESNEKHSLLVQAVKAVSLVNLSNHTGSNDLALQAKRSYGTAISHLNKTLSAGDFQSDATLTAVLFLNYYQAFSAESPSTDVWNTHSDALSMLLRLRGTSSQFTDPRVGGITRAAYYSITYRNMTRRMVPGPEIKLMDRAMELYPEAHWAVSSLAWSRITRLVPQCDEILAGDCFTDTASQRLLDTITTLQTEEQKYLIWYANHGSLIDANGPTQDALDIVYLNNYRATRIMLLRLLTDLANRVRRHFDLGHKYEEADQIEYAAQNNARAMANEIASSTGDIMDKFEGKGAVPWNSGGPIAYFCSIPPLGFALSVRTLSELDQARVKELLRAVSSKVGLRRPLPERAAAIMKGFDQASFSPVPSLD